MSAFSHPSNNRLLALEQELLRQKQWAMQQQDQQQPIDRDGSEFEQYSRFQQHNPINDDPPIANRKAAQQSITEDVGGNQSQPFSYGILAEMLHRRTGNSVNFRADHSPSIVIPDSSIPAPVPEASRSMSTETSIPEISIPEIPTSEVSIPEISTSEIPTSEIPPVQAPTCPSSAFSDGADHQQYAALMQKLQAARQGSDRLQQPLPAPSRQNAPEAHRSAQHPFNAPEATMTIEVEAQTIMEDEVLDRSISAAAFDLAAASTSPANASILAEAIPQAIVYPPLLPTVGISDGLAVALEDDVWQDNLASTPSAPEKSLPIPLAVSSGTHSPDAISPESIFPESMLENIYQPA